MPSNVRIQLIPQPHPEPRQQRPNIWMGTKVKEQATQSKPKPEEDYCDICTSNGRICSCTWHKFTNHLDIEQSNRVNADIEEVGNYRARTPLRRPRQLLKVLIFQPRRPLVRWLCGVRLTAPPTSDQVQRSYYVPSPPPNEHEHEQEPK